MSHEVEKMMSMKDRGQQDPWHIKETRERVALLSEQPASYQDAMKAAGLDWTVETVPLFADIGNDELAPVPMSKAVRRTSDGAILSTVGRVWRPVQNETAFQVLDDLVRAKICQYETAGSLCHGRLVWVMMRVNGTTEVVPGDKIGNYLLFWNAHSIEKMPSFAPTQVRVVCNNTLTMAAGKAKDISLRVKHGKHAETRVRAMGELFGPALASFERNVTMFRDLAKFQMGTGTMDAYLEKLWPNPQPKPGAKNKIDPDKQAAAKTRAAVRTVWEEQFIDADLPARYRHTAWTAFNAVCQYIDHVRGKVECRREQSWLRAGRKEREEALDLICQVAHVERPSGKPTEVQ